MTFKRLEVHLRSNFSTEASLRDEMSHIEDVYGGKTDFIKQRVLLVDLGPNARANLPATRAQQE